jgi:hypothetical protein
MHQLSLPSRTFGAAARTLSRALPNVTAALQASLLAGTALLLVLAFIGVVAYDESPWRLLRAIAALMRGPDVLDDADEFDLAIVATGLALFYAVSTLYGMALSFLLSDSPRRYAVAIGLAYGFALYSAVFHGLAARYPWLAAYRTIDTLIAHVLYGALLARAYCAFRHE